ncbi:MAG: hypothetical protein KKD28_02690, partial [Chloroflexi bacterium]|nr:hypothetical protein [Chloroflexota bacterium]
MITCIMMAQSPDHLRYHAYILRLWQERPATSDQSSVWRFSLEDTRTRQRRGFADLDKMLAFLQTQVCESTNQRISD